MRNAAKFLLVLVCMIVVLAPLSSAQSRREQRQQPEKLLDIAGIKPGMIVGEAGAGDGFLAFFISRRIGDAGRVYANDIDKNALRRLNERCAREGVKNITTILGETASEERIVWSLPLDRSMRSNLNGVKKINKHSS